MTPPRPSYPVMDSWTPERIEHGPRRPDNRITDKRDPPEHDLVVIDGCRIHRAAAEALARMRAAAVEAGFRPPLLRVISGYRSSSLQRQLYEAAVRKHGADKAREWVAPPGESAHQSGRALDLELGGPVDSSWAERLRVSQIHQWLMVNAVRFGFYPYSREPWHWEFNP